MITKRQVEALKKADKKGLHKLVKRAVRPKLDKEKLFLQRQLMKTDKELYNLYKSKDFLIVINDEKEALKMFLKVGSVLKKTRYSPNAYEVYNLIEAMHRAKVSTKELEQALREIDAFTQDPEEKKRLKSRFLRRLFISYQNTGMQGGDLAQYALEQVLRVKGKKRAERASEIRRAVEDSEKQMQQLGVEDSTLKQLLQMRFQSGVETSFGAIPEKLARIEEINPAYAKQARAMILSNLKSALSTGRFNEETVQILEERLDTMLQEARRREESK